MNRQRKKLTLILMKKITEENLKTLAQKIQLKIDDNKLANFVRIFDDLNPIITNFEKLSIEENIEPMKGIDLGSLTLDDLEEIKEGFSDEKLSIQEIKRNCLMTSDNFVIFKKTNE